MNPQDLFKRLARITGIKPEETRPAASKMNRELLNYYFKQQKGGA